MISTATTKTLPSRRGNYLLLLLLYITGRRAGKSVRLIPLPMPTADDADVHSIVPWRTSTVWSTARDNVDCGWKRVHYDETTVAL